MREVKWCDSCGKTTTWIDGTCENYVTPTTDNKTTVTKEMKATDKPLTLQECKDKVAKSYAYPSWRSVLVDFMESGTDEQHVNNYINEASELYKDSALEAQKKEIERLKAYIQDYHGRIKNLEANEKFKVEDIEALKQALKKANNWLKIVETDDGVKVEDLNDLLEEIENLLK